MSTQELWISLRNPDCSLCDLGKTAQWICLIGRGPAPADIMFVAEAPGLREDDIGKPFAGRAGQVLDLILDSLGLTRAEVYITNAAKCRPPDNRDPTPREVNTCSNIYLAAEIEAVNPKLIICLGRWATLAVLGIPKSIDDSRRMIFEARWGDVPTIVTYHPAICFYPGRGAKYGTTITNDIKWGIQTVITRGAPKEAQFIYDTTLERFDEYREKSQSWALDIETNGKDLFKDEDYEIVSLAMSPAKGLALFQVGQVPSVNAGRRILSDPEAIVIGHSIKFDLKGLRKCGLRRKDIKAKLRCTLIMSSLVDENYPNRKLEHLCLTRLDATPWKEKAKEVQPHNLSLGELMDYNSKDSIWDRYLYFDLLKECREQDLMKTLDLDMATTLTLVEAELAGIQIWERAFKGLCKEYRRRMNKLKAKIKVDNPESTQQISTLLFDQLGLIPPDGEEKGKSGFYSTREEVLLKLQGEHVAVKRTLRYRMYATRVKMFLDGLDEASGIVDDMAPDWKIHPTFNIAKVLKGGGEKDDEGGTTSGRTSCKNPNFQQFPREQDDIPRELNIRIMVVSRWFDEDQPKRGGQIGKLDYKQGEVVLGASESRDPWMLDLLEKGEDFHLMSAADFTKKEVKEVTKFERKKAKTGVFSTMYRGGIAKLARSMNISYEEAEAWWWGFKKKASGLEKWAKEKEVEIIEQGRIRHAGGRVRHLPGANKYTQEGREQIRSGINMIIQGLLGDITKHAMNRLCRRLWKERMRTRILGIVHDEVVLDVYRGEEDDVAYWAFKECEAAPNDICTLQLPMRIDFAVGPNWLDTKKVRREEYATT